MNTGVGIAGKKVLVVGSGGREHAIAWALARSYKIREVVAIPGNPGMSKVARVLGGGVDNASVLAAAQAEQPDFIVIGPEAPLVAGLADELRAAGFMVFGPNRRAAMLEGSKRYAKEFMARNTIPAGRSRAFKELGEALDYLDSYGAPVVVKDDRLASGKGVTVCHGVAEARAAVTAVITSGGEVLLEEFLEGEELSVLLFIDSNTHRLMPITRDHKRALDGDTGPMTGGMGTVAPIAFDDDLEFVKLNNIIVEPVMNALRREHPDYNGVLFIGVMKNGFDFRVLEFNVRFGDPEAQVLMMLLDTDPLELFWAVARERLHTIGAYWLPGAAACVVMAAPGYPEAATAGVPLSLPEKLPDNVQVFHAGVKADEAGGGLVTSGGRAIGVTARAKDVKGAVAQAYAVVDQIVFPGAVLRHDIGAGLGKSWRERFEERKLSRG